MSNITSSNTIDTSRLSNVLAALNTKTDLFEFANRYDLPFKQSLKKQDLAEYIEKNLLERLEVLMYVLPKEELLNLQKIVHAGGYLETKEALNVFELEYRTLLLRPEEEANPTGKFRYEIPSNLQQALSFRIDSLVNDPYVEKWDKNDRTCIGLLNLYGVLSETNFLKLWKKVTGDTLGWRDFFTMLRSRALVVGLCQPLFTNEKLCLASSMVYEPAELYEAIKKRKDLEYKVYPLEMVLLAADSYLNIVDSDLLFPLVSILDKLNEGDLHQSEVLLTNLWLLHQNGARTGELISALTNELIFDSTDQVQTTVMALTNFTNGLPNWLLKGHSPDELHSKRQGDVKEQTHNMIPFSPKPTVGRNDPCPCGSGKKYKKCCGLN